MNPARRPLLLTLLAALCLLALRPSAEATGAARTPYTLRSVPIGGGGYVTDVYCHPRQRDLVYIRTDVGGFYRWDPAGWRWIPLTDMFPRSQSNFYGGEGLALDPRDPNVVYIAAGKYTYDSPGRIFKSTDRGHTWKPLPLALKMGGNEDHRWGGPRLVVSPADPRHLLFGSRKDGLWRSDDAGASWSKVTAFPARLRDGVGVNALAFGLRQPGEIFAAAYGDGVYASEDGGRSWRRTPGGPAEVERLAAASDGALYATHAHGVARYFHDAWTDVTPPGQGGGFDGLSVNPRDPRDVLAAVTGDRLRLFRSRDGGATWVQKQTVVHSSVPWYSGSMRQIQATAALAFDPCVPGRVWLTDWYATYVTGQIAADPAVFASHELGHEELVVFTMLSAPGGPPLLSGTADVDGFVHDSLTAFPAHGLGDYYGGKGPTYGYTEGFAWCASRPERVARAGVIPWNNAGGVSLSSDGGRTWTAAPGWDSKVMAARVAMSAADPDNLVVLRVHAGPPLTTRDGGASWRPAAGLPADLNLIPDVWNWQAPLAADGARPGVFYVYHDRTLSRSTDGGATFTPAATGLPSGDQVLLQSVPGRAGELWLALGSAGLFHSTDGGMTFHGVSGVKEALLFAPGHPAPGRSDPALYLYGRIRTGPEGIFRSLDGARTWQPIGDPRVPVGDVPNCMAASFQTFGRVFIGTNGRGIYTGAPTEAETAAP